jgi:hypothetical protein
MVAGEAMASEPIKEIRMPGEPIEKTETDQPRELTVEETEITSGGYLVVVKGDDGAPCCAAWVPGPRFV